MDSKNVVPLGKEFINSPFGEYFAEWLQKRIVQLYTEVEIAVTNEEKISKIDRAAGIKEVQSYLTSISDISEMRAKQV